MGTSCISTVKWQVLAWLFQVVYEGEIQCLYTVTFWEKVDFHIITYLNTCNFTVHQEKHLIINIYWTQKFWEITTLDLSCVVTVKSTVVILQNFVAFSKYMNFTRNSCNNTPCFKSLTYKDEVGLCDTNPAICSSGFHFRFA